MPSGLQLNRNLALLATITLFWLAACRKSETPAPAPPPPPPPPPVVNIYPPPDLGFYVVGYMPSYRDPNTIPDVKFKMCNVINYAFGSVTSSGGLSIANPARLTLVAEKAKRNGAKIMLSINGAVADWKQMAGTASGRTDFIRQLMNAVRSNQLDGIDIDWEFPSTSDGTSVTFTQLMQELGDSCHVGGKYYLSAAITAGKYAGGYRDAITTELIQSNKVDFFNIMAYDDFSTSVLYRHHSDYTLSETCLNYWINTKGMPKKKAILGLPAYGRPSGITQTGTVLSYAGILAQGGNARADSATVTVAPQGTYTIYYNGQPTIKRKTMLAKSVGNGVMFWEKGQDANDDLSLIKAACDTIGRAY